MSNHAALKEILLSRMSQLNQNALKLRSGPAGPDSKPKDPSLEKTNPPAVDLKRAKNFSLTKEVQKIDEPLRKNSTLINGSNFEQSMGGGGFRDSTASQLPGHRRGQSSYVRSSVGYSQNPADSSVVTSLKQSMSGSLGKFLGEYRKKSCDQKRRVMEVDRQILELKRKIFDLEGKNSVLKKEVHNLLGKQANAEFYRNSRSEIDKKIQKASEMLKSKDDANEQHFKLRLQNEGLQKARLEERLPEICVQMKENSQNIEIKKLLYSIKQLKYQISRKKVR